MGNLLIVNSVSSEPALLILSQSDSESEEEHDICRAQNAPNLIQNPSFEGNYGEYVPEEPIDDCRFGVCQTAQIPQEGGWIPFWRSHDDNDPGFIIRQPEYKPACVGTDPCVFANRLRDGKEAQQYFTFFSTHEAGIMQSVEVIPGLTYCLSGWGHSWSAQDDDDAISGPEDGQLHQKVGIDPTGGTDWMSEDIVWSDQDVHPLGRIQYDEYGLFTVTQKTDSSKVSVYFYSQPEFAVKHNNVYWDDTYLGVVGPTHLASITKTADINVLTDISNTVQASQTIKLSLVGYGSTVSHTWSATISPTNSLTPVLSSTTGSITDTLTISVDSTGLNVGSYSADITLTISPETATDPFTIPVRVVVADKVYQTFLPIVLR